MKIQETLNKFFSNKVKILKILPSEFNNFASEALYIRNHLSIDMIIKN